jgi:hypothetical protein
VPCENLSMPRTSELASKRRRSYIVTGGSSSTSSKSSNRRSKVRTTRACPLRGHVRSQQKISSLAITDVYNRFPVNSRIKSLRKVLQLTLRQILSRSSRLYIRFIVANMRWVCLDRVAACATVTSPPRCCIRASSSIFHGFRSASRARRYCVSCQAANDKEPINPADALTKTLSGNANFHFRVIYQFW